MLKIRFFRPFPGEEIAKALSKVKANVYTEALHPNYRKGTFLEQKAAANDVLSKKKYESLSQITDYTQFARELDKIYDTSSQREQMLIESALRRDYNENFARYEQQRTALGNLVGQIVEDEYFDDMDENDVNMFMHTLTYLSDKGISV